MKLRSISFTEKDLKRLVTIARRRRTSVSAVVREVVAEYINKSKAEEEKHA